MEANLIRPLSVATVVIAALGALSRGAIADMLSCAPDRTEWSSQSLGAASDPDYQFSVRQWRRKFTGRRELEGEDASVCQGPLLRVPGYEGFPVYECSYKSNGGDDSPKDKRWPEIRARVRVLDPSVEQLGIWTVNACYDNGAQKGSSALRSCITKTVNYIWAQNNAQFPVSGIVIERRCDVSGRTCNGSPPRSPLRQPLNMSFRDGITATSGALGQGTPGEEIQDDKLYEQLFSEDRSTLVVRNFSRVANATRAQWTEWVRLKGRTVVPEGLPPSALNPNGTGWLDVSREVHKAACAGDHNALIGAMVHGLRFVE